MGVKDVQEEDLGVYRCSEDGEEIVAFHLDISVRVKKFPPSFSIDEGSSTDPKKSLKCEVFSADQEIQFKWFSRPEDEDSASKTLNPVCAQVIGSLTLIFFINLFVLCLYYDIRLLCCRIILFQ